MCASCANVQFGSLRHLFKLCRNRQLFIYSDGVAVWREQIPPGTGWGLSIISAADKYLIDSEQLTQTHAINPVGSSDLSSGRDVWLRTENFSFGPFPFPSTFWLITRAHRHTARRMRSICVLNGNKRLPNNQPKWHFCQDNCVHIYQGAQRRAVSKVKEEAQGHVCHSGSDTRAGFTLPR